jgi:hypothetical protein
MPRAKLLLSGVPLNLREKTDNISIQTRSGRKFIRAQGLNFAPFFCSQENIYAVCESVGLFLHFPMAQMITNAV